MKNEKNSAEKISAPVRNTYRHGDLRRALLEAGIELARAGGPDAVVLREATRRAGVVPNAAYRHFANRDDLLDAVRDAALSALARSIERAIERVEPRLSPHDSARAQLRAVGIGYLRFASDEPGLFRAAFTVTAHPTDDAANKGDWGLNPFQLLGAVIDKMVYAGLLPPERRSCAEYLAWSSVHGLAMLCNEGPLSRLSPAQREDIGQKLVAMVERGL